MINLMLQFRFPCIVMSLFSLLPLFTFLFISVKHEFCSKRGLAVNLEYGDLENGALESRSGKQKKKSPIIMPTTAPLTPPPPLD